MIISRSILKLFLATLLLSLLATPFQPTVNAQATADDAVDADSQTEQPAENSSIVVFFDDGELQEKAAQRRAERGLRFNDVVIRQEQNLLLRQIQRRELSPFVGERMSVVKHYDNFPASVIQVVDTTVIAELEAQPGITAVIPNMLFEPSLPQSLPFIGQDIAAANGFTGKNTAVAILDTGVDWTHPAFGSCTSPGQPAATCRVVSTLELAPDDGSLDDTNHGTNVAGIVAGVAPDTKILSYDVFWNYPGCQSDSGVCADVNGMLSALDHVVNMAPFYNIVAVNMSLGFNTPVADPAVCFTMGTVFTNLQNNGIMPIAATGNEGFKNQIMFPACAPAVVSVGAVDDTTGAIPSFSQSSPALDLLAPGRWITAAGITMQGTSMASPHVAGAWAVLRSSKPNLTLPQTLQLLKDTGIPTTDSNGVTRSIIQLDKALGIGNIPGAAELNDYYGTAVATGDFNGDGYLDVVTGGPNEAIGNIPGAGSIFIIYGSIDRLNPTTSEAIHQDSLHVPGTAEINDAFGSALAAGDFDGDGYTDLAVGVPGEAIDALAGAGAVNIFYGSANGLRRDNSQLWSQDSTGISGASEFNDAFGAALAAGDFNGDGRDDLAIGAPGEAIGNFAWEAGAVNVLYGSGSGLTATGQQIWSQDSAGIRGGSELNDNFGAALAAGDFNGDGRDDLAIGVPGEAVNANSVMRAGAVNVLYGTTNRLSAANDQFWSQNEGILGTSEINDEFGAALASGDFNGDGRDDLAIGVPGEAIGSLSGAGAVNVLYGSSSRLSSSNNQFWSQQSSGIAGSSEMFDGFGTSLTSGDFNGDGRDDLAVGVPGEAIGSDVTWAAGAVNVLYGSANRLGASGNQIWHQNSDGVAGGVEMGDRFGEAVAAGDFNGDGRDDLAVGVPEEDISVIENAGAINVLYGNANGIHSANDQIWHQDS